MSTVPPSRFRRLVRGLAKLLLGLVALLLVVGTVAFVARYEIFRRLNDLPPWTHDGGDVTTVMVPMADGVALHTRIVRPAGDGPAPTLLFRNPYSVLTPTLWLQCGAFARWGYACVQQDVRGQGRSDGAWEPLRHERDDGLATLQWLKAQPFVDGNIGLLGPSYLGAVQWAMADDVPPEVKTMVPMAFGPDMHPVMYERGLFRHDVMTAWAALMPTSGMRFFRGGDDYAQALAHHPHETADVAAFGVELPWYREWLNNPALADLVWQRPDLVKLRTVPSRVRTPMLLIGGFFDPFFMAQERAWQQLGSQADSAFVIGPWNHLGEVSGDMDINTDIETDMAHAGGGTMQWPLLLDWLGHHLKGQPLTLLRKGEVRLLAPGDSRWRTLSSWPATSASMAGSTAGSTTGTVAATTAATNAATSVTFAPGSLGVAEAGVLPMPSTSKPTWQHDPRAPMPSHGGASLLAFSFFPEQGVIPGPVEQGPPLSKKGPSTSRRGITMRSTVLPSELFISGGAHLELTVTSTTADTAVVARLIVEGQDQPGDALLVREAAATLSFPTSENRAATMDPPGTPVTLTFDFWPIAWRVPKGARLRLDLTSSSFPALANHSNRLAPWARETDADFGTVADLALVDDGSARLTLPLWSAAAATAP